EREISRLAALPPVVAVDRTEVHRPLDIGLNSAAVGAPTWWAAGFLGGAGARDLPATIAVDQDPVLQSHPAFRGVVFETPSGTTPLTSPSLTRHGTALLSTAIARGPSGCASCLPADIDEDGIAPEVSKVLDPSGAGAETHWAAGVPYYWYDAGAGRWELQ